MQDIQNQKPVHSIKIDKVGIKDLKYPIRVLRKDNTHLSTIADIEACVALPSGKKGTHMSRFIELIEKFKHDINGSTISRALKEMLKTFNTDYGKLSMKFSYFIEKRAPVSRISSIMEVQSGFIWENTKGVLTHTIFVKVPVTTLCPCSKEISEYGAHNQRAYVYLEVQPYDNEWIWFEDLVDIVEQCASAPIYPLLKRMDEKYVTELAYNNPRFVEDLIREVYQKIHAIYNNKIDYISVHVESDESIHQHKAFAQLSRNLQENKK